MFEVGDVVAGYTVDEFLGGGATADVFRVHRGDDGHTVALKVLHPKGSDPTRMRERFDREVVFEDRDPETRFQDRFHVFVNHGFATGHTAHCKDERERQKPSAEPLNEMRGQNFLPSRTSGMMNRMQQQKAIR